MIYVVSTFPPKSCGIAVFAGNFVKAIKDNLKTKEEVSVLAMVDDKNKDDSYSKDVVFKIDKDNQKDYILAANFVNINKPRVCIIQHEFGIFGGNNGIFILSFIARLQVPSVVVLHTILQTPNHAQSSIIKEMAKRTNQLVVMSRLGVEYLKDIYGVLSRKISFIPHGVPTFSLPSHKKLKKKFFWSEKKILMTFGLLSRNKGIETAILAMVEIIKDFPEVMYIIIGRTHPEVVKSQGEEYRNYLINLVESNKLTNNVIFIDNFLIEEKIIEYVKAADLYLTPYRDPNQITSGTLSYAIGNGIAIVSTPYRYAEEMANQGCGRLFPFSDPKGLAKVVKEIFTHPQELKKMNKQCLAISDKMSWSKVGSYYLKLFSTIEKTNKKVVQSNAIKINLLGLPILNFSHIYKLTDQTGIIQHARFNIPYFKEGYCIDDNARSLILMTMAHRINKDAKFLEMISIYLSFITYMINEDGTTRNFLSYNRDYLDTVGSDDCFGRTVWSIGYLIRFSPLNSYQEIGQNIFLNLSKQFDNVLDKSSVRGLANTIIGISYYLQVNDNDEIMINHITKMSDKLIKIFEDYATSDWLWFEKTLTYDNAILPLALLRVGELLKNKKYLEVGIKATEFLNKKSLIHNFYQPIGNENWFSKGGVASNYDQQPIEILGLTWLNYQAYRVANKTEYIENLHKAFRWFLGDNSVGISLYDYETKGCCDGLEKEKVNRNQGAESTIAFWISYCLVFLSVQFEHEYLK